MTNKSDFISRTRQTVADILARFYADWAALYAQYAALGYAAALEDGDFGGANADLAAAEFVAAVAAVNNVKGALDGNSPTIWPLQP
jgi:hypothetical protein